MKPVIYIAGPYRDPRGAHFIKQNIRTAEACAIRVWQLGAVALCPHLNVRFFDGILPDQVWMDGDLELLSRCDASYFYAGFEASEGTRAEYKFCAHRGYPAFTAEQDVIEFINKYTNMHPAKMETP